jgi:hypothetical protein
MGYSPKRCRPVPFRRSSLLWLPGVACSHTDVLRDQLMDHG